MRKQQPRLLENRSKTSLIVRGRMDDIADQVVPGHTVATTPANKGVVAPLIHNLAAESAAGVLGPGRHSETTA